MATVVALLLGIAAGAAAAGLVLRRVAREREAAREEARTLERELGATRTEIEVSRRSLDAEREALDARVAAAVKALSADALRQSNESFLALAETKLQGYVSPLKDSLEQVQTHVSALEQARVHAFGALKQELTTLRDGQERLRTETGNLVTALRAPHVRGRWGEVQLKRVVEEAGLLEHCDFVLQSTVRDDEGALLRPDLVVRLPGGKHVVVDAKVPLAAYLDACAATDGDVRALRVADHARQVRDHIGKLAAKAYWRQFEPAPDFVIMFLPDESFLRTALEHDGTLMEYAWASQVVPASPTNLFALLRTVAATWQQDTVAQSAREVHALGQELYDRLGTMAGHIDQLGRSLKSTVGHFNRTVGSLESRVLVTGRKLRDHGIAGDELPALAPLEEQPSALNAPELVEALESAPRALDAA